MSRLELSKSNKKKARVGKQSGSTAYKTTGTRKASAASKRQLVLTHTADGQIVRAEVVGGKAVKAKKFVI